MDGRQRREGLEPQSAQYATEESDAVVVPEKPTKTRVTPVEPVEGRAAAKGKSAARNASPAQDGQDALTFLQRIGRRAKDKPKEKLTNLVSHIKLPLLREAYQRLRRKSAAGVDGVTWDEYGEGLDAKLLDLQDRVHRGSYHPQPVRRVHIPKGDGSTRPLGIPSLEDKIVQQAARMVLEPIYEAMFVGFSYGFRPRRSQHDALDALAAAIARKVSWVLDADIRSFFNTIDHGWMQKFIEHRIGDSRMVRLLMKWMRAGVMEDGELHAVQEGSPQGAVISPLLANIYLHYVIDLWVHQWRKRHSHGEVYVVRYADDLVMAFQREQDAHAVHEALGQRLARFGLELHPDKTKVLEFGRFACEDRARRGLGKPKTFDFLGFTHIVGVSRSGKSQLQRCTSRKKRRAKLAAIKEECQKRRHRDVAEQHAWLCSVLTGHYRYYGVPTNMRALRQFEDAVTTIWHRALQRRSQRGSWTLVRQRSFKRRFPLPPPRIVHPWPSRRFAAR
ncbi:MAG TPA: group II intron reverse transcriptase/maturase [Fimbriimonadaceae bacterium]|nr:group II intron reverse transcriptase/maturase [Fimbriimonadaceae bacterium]